MRNKKNKIAVISLIIFNVIVISVFLCFYNSNKNDQIDSAIEATQEVQATAEIVKDASPTENEYAQEKEPIDPFEGKAKLTEHINI